MTRRTRSVGAVVALALLIVLALLAGCGVGADPGSTTASGRPTAATAATPTGGAGRTTRDPETGLALVELDTLPRQVRDTVALIDRGGPYPNRQDGAVFGNREQLLPRRAGGYYREYTVLTPGSADRGARRVVTGDANRQFFYTGDHYASFVRIRR